MEEPVVIRVSDLTKNFSNTRRHSLMQLIRGDVEHTLVLDSISFTVKKGELLGVMGRNGAGKSTLLRLLGNVYQPSSGVVYLASAPSSLFEMGTFLDINASGKKYCKDYFSFFEISKKKSCDLIAWVKEFSELGAFFDKPVREYSSGMMAKLLFSVAVALPAEVYLIDEALVVGDKYFQAKAWKRLFDLLDKGASGVIVSHDWGALLTLCQQSIVIQNGKIKFQGETYKAVQAYLNILPEKKADCFILEDMAELSDMEWEIETAFVFRRAVAIKTLPPGGQIAFKAEILKPTKFGIPLLLTELGHTIPIEKTGVHHLAIYSEKLCLPAGDYLINFIVALPSQIGSGNYEKIYDEQRGLHLHAFSREPNPPSSAFFTQKFQWGIQNENRT